MTRLFATYAIEPEVFEDWNNLRLIHSSLGSEHGRLVVSLPEKKKYTNCVKNALHRSTNTTSDHILRGEIIRLLRRSSVQISEWFSSDNDWLEAMENKQRNQNICRAIIASDNPRDASFVIEAHELHGAHPDWKISGDCEVDRQPTEIANTIAPLFQLASRKITLVDPHFDPCKHKFREFLATIMSKAVDRPDGPRTDLTFVYNLRACDQPGDSPDPPHRDFKLQAEENLTELIPKGCTLKLQRWRERTGTDFHDRFIMTSNGGVQIGAGLSKQSNRGEKTSVHLLSQDLLRRKLNEYRREESPFELVDFTTLPAE